MLIYGFPPVLCSGDFIALNFRMFIALVALVLVYKFIIVGTFSFTREFVISPTPFFGAKSSLSYININLHPVF